jgi:hypothetical protein
MGVMDFLSPEARQGNRRWLDEQDAKISEALRYYFGAGTQVPQQIGLMADSTPSAAVDRAGQDAMVAFGPETSGWGRVTAIGDMLSELAGGAAAVPGIGAAGRLAGDVVDAAAPSVRGLLDEVPEFVADESGAFRLRTPGPFTVRGNEFFDQPHGIARKKDPALYTGYSSVKHSVPPSEFEFSGQVLPTLSDPDVVDPAALKGRTLYFPTGDRTSNQRVIESINGVALPRSVTTHGGPEYKDYQGSWASEPNALAARANGLKPGLLEGEDQLLAYMPMGERSGDFSRHMAEAYGSLVDGQTSGHNMRGGLDRVIPDEFRELNYPGVNSSQFSSWLTGLDGGKRAAVIKYLDSAVPQGLGMPDVSAVRFAVTNPDLVQSEALNVGYRFSKPDMVRGLLRTDEHPSYGAKLERAPGTGSQTLGYEVPWRIGARDAAASKVTERGYALPKDIKSFMGNPKLKQTVDDQWVEEVSTYGNLLNSEGKDAAAKYARGLLDAILASR